MRSWGRWGGALIVLALALLGVGPAFAKPTYPAPPDGYVSDQQGNLRPDTVARLNAELAEYEQRSSNEIAIAIIETTDGRDIADYSKELFNSWGVGQASSDNGILLVVAMNDRKLRLAVGDGLSEKLSDSAAASIVDQEIVPRLKNGDLDGGVEAAVIGVRRALGDDVSTPDTGSTATREPVPGVVGVEERYLYREPDYAPDHSITPGPSNPLEPLFQLGFWAVLLVGGATAITRGFSNAGGGDRCPTCRNVLSRRAFSGQNGSRWADLDCPQCGYHHHDAHGPGWGAGSSIFGSGFWAGSRSRDDGGGGSFGSGSSSGGGASGSFGSSSGSGGGGSSSGGGASGSW